MPSVVVRKPLAAVVAAAVLLAVAAASARADGDPASDVLYGANVFLPYPKPSTDVADALLHQVDAVWADKRSRVKVAVIAGPIDLGAIPSLFDKPDEYAHFLGQELGFVYAGPLLIVMPAGFGIYDAGRPTTAARKALADVKIAGKTADDLTRAATAAVAAMYRAGVLATKDILPPQAYVFGAFGHLGLPMAIKYTIIDDSGRGAATLTVLASGPRTLARFRIPMRAFNPHVIPSVTWKVPQTLPSGAIRACIVAVDPSGNRSKRFCTPVRIT